MDISEQKIKLPSNIIIKKKDGKYLFLNPDAPAWVVVNSNGALALKLCRGSDKTINDIIQIVSKALRKDATEEIKNFFSEILQNSNIFLESDLSSNLNPYNLKIVHLNLTSKCNLKCVYCYAEERRYAGNILTYEDYVKILDSVKNISKGVEIVLTGGEPLLSPNVFLIAEYAKKLGNKVHMLSNGTLIDDSNVKKIAELFDLVKLSLDGSTPEIHDSLRGGGSHCKTTKAIDLLIKNKANVQVSMTTTKKNIHDIGNMAKIYGSLLSFAPLFKAGRAKKNRALEITGKEYYNALSSVTGINPLSCLCSSLETAKTKKIIKCAIADAEISISDTGDVYPCHMLHIPQFWAGNIKEQPLESIYQNSKSLNYCKKINVLGIKKCKKCDIRFICGGACRARAFFEKGKIDVADDFCEYEKLAYINGIFEFYEIN